MIRRSKTGGCMQANKIRVPVWLLLSCLTANSQQNFGVIRGVVHDSSGAVIVGASVVAQHQGIGVESTTSTNEAGAFVIPNLNVGVYKLTVEFKGFQTVQKTDLRLIAGLTL